MADIINQRDARPHSSRKHRIKSGLPPRVDMTPMVDLAFLLITFFMLTSVLNEQKAMIWQKTAEGPPDAVSECQVLNILVDSSDRVFVYEGDDIQNLSLSSFDAAHGLQQQIMDKDKKVKASCPLTTKGEKKQVICLIKLLPGARYKNMVDILDDMNLLGIQSYAIQEPLKEETAAIKEKTKILFAKN